MLSKDSYGQAKKSYSKAKLALVTVCVAFVVGLTAYYSTSFEEDVHGLIITEDPASMSLAKFPDEQTLEALKPETEADQLEMLYSYSQIQKWNKTGDVIANLLQRNIIASDKADEAVKILWSEPSHTTGDTLKYFRRESPFYIQDVGSHVAEGPTFVENKYMKVGGYMGYYTGFVNANNQAQGLGRFEASSGYYIEVGQWQNGSEAGYVKLVNRAGWVTEWKNGHERKIRDYDN